MDEKILVIQSSHLNKNIDSTNQMTTLNPDYLLGEAGDVLIRDEVYQEFFPKCPSELDEGYRRLTRLPLANDIVPIITDVGNTLLMITTEGRILLVNYNRPEGVHIDIGIPNIKKVWNSRPFMILDESNTLHFRHLDRVFRENIPYLNPYFLVVSSTINNWEIVTREIDNAEWVITYDNYTHTVGSVIIKIPEGLIISDPYSISKGDYKIREDIGYNKIGNCISYYEDGARFVVSNLESFQISDDIIDVIYSRGFNNGTFYAINSRDELSFFGRNVSPFINRKKTPDFSPTRLFSSTESGEAYVEDSGGNIYNAKKVITRSGEPESLDLPVILHGFQQTGRRVKPARHLSS